MKYFRNVDCIEELKKQYKNLAMTNHPDRGGSEEVMKEINNEYDCLFQKYKNIHKSAKGETFEAKKETAEAPDFFRNIINEIIKLQDLVIEVCGRWLWVTGNTFIHKGTLKDLGFRFSSNKKAWYLRDDEDASFKKSGKTLTMEQIRERFGSEKYETEANQNILFA